MQNQTNSKTAESKPIALVFYPNDCFICKSTKNLHQCSRCQMISYCGEIHQKEHWDNHKEICEIISDLMRKKKVSHLFENLRGVDDKRRAEEREKVLSEIQAKLSRPFDVYEVQMFLYPRVCFVCYEAKQHILTNCPSCPSVSFCPAHKDLRRHAINCFNLKVGHDLDVGLDNKVYFTVMKITTAITDAIIFDSEFQNPPKSMKQLMMHYPKRGVEISDNLLIYASHFLTSSLTLFKALQNIKLPSASKIVIHVIRFQNIHPKFLEIILHLIPSLKVLKIVFVDANQLWVKDSELCNNCLLHNKGLEIVIMPLSYEDYLKEKNYEKPHMLVFYSASPPEEGSCNLHHGVLKSRLLSWRSFSCPLVLTTDTEAKAKEIKQMVKTTFSRHMIYYDGCNEFASMWPGRSITGETSKENQFMIIFKVLHDEKGKAPVVGKVEKKLDSVVNKVESSNFVADKVESSDSIANKTESLNSVSSEIEFSNSIANKIEPLNSVSIKIESSTSVTNKTDSSNSVGNKIESSNCLVNIIKKSSSSVANKIEKSLNSAPQNIEKSDSIEEKIEKASNSVANKTKKSSNSQENIQDSDFDKDKIEKSSNSLANQKGRTPETVNANTEKSTETDTGKIDKSLECRTDKLEKKSSVSDDNEPLFEENDWNFYCTNACQVCHLTFRCFPCTRCKMISYCQEQHRKKHWPQHKDLCKVILGLLKETGGTTLFDKLKTNDMESWVKIKVAVMLKVQTRLGRPLVNYERQMFLFPKTCFVCHESDQSVLKTCDCGISFCRQHKKNPRHNSLCPDFQMVSMLAQVMLLIRQYPMAKNLMEEIMKLSIKTIPSQKKIKKLPSSIKAFINFNIKLSKEHFEPFEEYRIQITSEFFSRPLTMLYAIQKLELTLATSFTIHVIGATPEEITFVDYWEVLLHWLPNLKEIRIDFIGPELKKSSVTMITVCNSCESLGKKSKLILREPLRYDEYFKDKSFSKPDIIIGFNLDLHESEYGISECTWKETIALLTKLDAPFIMTAGTEERANKDHKRLCNLLEKTVSYDFCEENPFATLIPERDFETEEIKYANKYIIIYKRLYEGLKESDKVKEIPAVVTPESTRCADVIKYNALSKVTQDKKETVELETKPRIVKAGELQKQFAEAKIKEEQKEPEVFHFKEKQVGNLEEDKKETVELETKPRIVKAGELQKQFAEAKIKEEQKEPEVFHFKEKQVENLEVNVKEASAVFAEKLTKRETERKTEKVESNTKLESRIENMDSKIKSVESKTKTSTIENSKSFNENLLKENQLLKEENELLKENLVLKEENNKLKSENQKLKYENERLRSENHLIKDLRKQVQESIRSAMSEKK